jgi:hypothetical protein
VTVQILIFLTLALVGDEWLTSSPGSITPGTHWMGAVQPKAGLNDVEERESNL